MKDLIEILSWCRGAGTVSEGLFVQEHIASIDGIWADEYGNYHLTIGEQPKILWSCHTDTVTRKEGRQNVRWIGKGILGLNNGQHGQCLGADDGAGVWIMKELIKNKRPGHYIFHRDEEIGGLGSSWISNNGYVMPESIQCAIAMDRCSTRDIITHQGFQRTASDAFARSLMPHLPDGMVPDDSGVFTDTANYTEILGECTNLSVGYERNHGKDETLDTNFLRKLRDSLVELDENQLEFSRQPGEVEYCDWYGYGGYGHTYHSNKNQDYDPKGRGSFPYSDGESDDVWDNYHGEAGERDIPLDDGGASMSMDNMVEEAPDVAARLLIELGVTRDEFRAHVFALKGRLLGA
jgi:hypothetical protein